MHVIVIGAGAIGSFIAASLAEGGADVTIIARGQRLEWLERHPVEIESEGGRRIVPVPVAAWSGLDRPVDVAFLCTKARDLPESLLALRPLLAGGGTVVTLQNGIEAPREAARMLPGAIVVASRVHGFFEMSGQDVRHVGVPPSLSLGCIDKGARAVPAIVSQVLEQAGIRHTISDDIVTTLWEKMLLSAGLGGLAAAQGINAGQVCRSAGGEARLRQVMEEIAALARASGAKLGAEDIEATLRFVRSFPESATTSLQRDLQAGTPSEYDALIGAALRVARARNVEAPLLAGIDDAIRARYPLAG